MLMRVWSVVAKCGPWIVMVILVLERLLTLVVEGFGLMLLMLGGIFLEYVGGWYPVVLVLHRFFIAISRAVANCDDSSGLAPHPLVWSAGGLPKRRRIVDVVRDVALLPGPLHLWDSGWVSVPPVIITAEDVCLWPYSVGILVKLVTFFGFSSLALCWCRFGSWGYFLC